MFGTISCAAVFLLAAVVTVFGHGNETWCPKLYTRFGSSCYKIYPYRFSWIEAQVFCQLDKAHLVFVDSMEEHKFLKSLGEKGGHKLTTNLWTGIIEFEGHYIRYAGRNVPAQHLHFVAGEPSKGSRDDCVTLAKKKDWKMEDFNCNIKLSFICEM